MARPRDSQRSKVYAAELESGGAAMQNPPARLKTVYRCQAWVDEITNSRWWQFRSGVAKVKVFDGRGTTCARGGYFGNHGKKNGWGVNLPKWARSEMVILHELAHILTPVNEPWHGRRFCRNYLALVGRWMSRDSAIKLRACFKKHRVKWVTQRRRSDE